LLVDHIQDELARRRAAAGLRPCERLDETAIAMLSRYDFPGNVRELRNIVERWAVLGAFAAPGEPAMSPRPESKVKEPAAAPEPSRPEAPNVNLSVDTSLLRLPYHEAKDAWTERFERAYVEAILAQSGGNVSRAAREAGVDRRHLQRLMARFGIKAASE
jgi:DNA-binding NtrC family response regulator